MRINNRIVGVSGVARAASATVPLEVNRRYHTVKLNTTIAGTDTVASSVISKILVKVNEAQIWEATATELLDFNASIGLPDPTGILSLHFSRPDLADIINEEATAFDLFGERSARIEVTMADTANVGFTAVEYYDLKPNVDAQGNPAKIIMRLNRFTETFPVGTKDWVTINKTRPITRILLQGANGIESVEVKADDRTIFEASAIVNKSMLTNYGIVATVHKFPVIFNFTNRLEDALLVSKSLNLRVTHGAGLGQDVTALVESISAGFQG